MPDIVTDAPSAGDTENYNQNVGDYESTKNTSELLKFPSSNTDATNKKTSILHSVSRMIDNSDDDSETKNKNPTISFTQNNFFLSSPSTMTTIPLPSFYDFRRHMLAPSLMPVTNNYSNSIQSPLHISTLKSFNPNVLQSSSEMWLHSRKYLDSQAVGLPNFYQMKSPENMGREEECKSTASESPKSSDDSSASSDHVLSSVVSPTTTLPPTEIPDGKSLNTERTWMPCDRLPSVVLPTTRLSSVDSAGCRRNRERTWLPCEVCNKKFDRPSLLRRHMRTHTGEKPHSCDVCGKAFSTSSSLNTHRRIHSGEKPHQCGVCGKRFTASSNLYYHKMTHNKEKPHKCSLCSKSFPTPGDLKSHMYVHNGCWPYKCDICNRGFSKQTNLKNHIMLHTGDKPHECQLCGKRFALHCNLKTHAKTHEGEAQEKCHGCQQHFLTICHKLYQGFCKGCIYKATQPLSPLARPTGGSTGNKISSFSIAELTKKDEKPVLARSPVFAPTVHRMVDVLPPPVSSGSFYGSLSLPGGFPYSVQGPWTGLVAPTLLPRY